MCRTWFESECNTTYIESPSGDHKPNTWCQKMPKKICAPDNCNMVQVLSLSQSISKKTRNDKIKTSNQDNKITTIRRQPAGSQPATDVNMFEVWPRMLASTSLNCKILSNKTLNTPAVTRLAARRQTRAELVAVAGAGGLPGQDDGLHHPEADGALRAAAPASLQSDHQAGAAPHH